MIKPGRRGLESIWNTSEGCLPQTGGRGSSREDFLEEEMSELGLEGHVTEGWSGECSKQKKQHLAKVGGERKRVLFEELEVGETGA